MVNGGRQGEEEEGRLHFRDPRSGYTVIPRDVEGEKEGEEEEGRAREREREKGREGRSEKVDERNQ